MNIKNINLKRKLILILLLSLFVFCSKVNAVEITSFTDFGDSEPSAVCGSNFCATELSDSGFRATLVNSNGNQVANTRILNIWSSATAASYASGTTPTSNIGGYSCDINFQMRKYNYASVVDANNPNMYNEYLNNIGITPGQHYHLYSQYFNETTLKSNPNRIINIINALMINGVTISDYSDLFLKIEPIFIIKEKYKGSVKNYGTIERCNYFWGTAKEIINTWGQSYWDSFGGYSENFTVNGIKSSWSAFSLGNSYVYGGCQSGAIGSHWNVVRNFAVSMYYTCGAGGPNVSAGQCLNSSENYLLDDISTCTNNRKNGKDKAGEISALINKAKGGNGLGVGYFKISDYIDTCQSRADALKGDKEGLTKLYVEYKSKGEDYRKLLDFNNPKCEVKTNCNPTNSSNVGCFSGNSGSSNDANDLSCYNDTVTAKTVRGNNNITGYCNASTKITNLLNKNSFSGISGRMLIDTKEFSNIELQLLCTFPEKVKSETIVKNTSPLKISDYLTYEVDNGDESIDLDKLNTSTDLNTITDASFYDIKLKGNLYFSYKYAKNASGEIVLEDCNNCKKIGHGYFTKLNSERGEIKFTYRFQTTGYDSSTKTGTCDYDLDEGIVIIDDLNVEFRSVDSNVYYFTNMNGNKRIPGENWKIGNDKKLDFNGDGTVNNADKQYLVKIINKQPGAYSIKYDLNKDGVINNNDIVFLTSYIEKKEGYESLLIKYVFQNTNNSYDKNRTGPIYRIELDSNAIKKIREYNENHAYDDYNMECANGINCKSEFLELYNIKKINILES